MVNWKAVLKLKTDLVKADIVRLPDNMFLLWSLVEIVGVKVKRLHLGKRNWRKSEII